MKTMKKILTAICSCVFTLALALGITVNVTKADTATAKTMSIGYAILRYTDGAPSQYVFVPTVDGDSMHSIDYTLDVVINGETVTATTFHNELRVDYSAYPTEKGDLFLLEIPAGTYFNTDEYLADESGKMKEQR